MRRYHEVPITFVLMKKRKISNLYIHLLPSGGGIDIHKKISAYSFDFRTKMAVHAFSRTPDRDFRCFNPCGVFLSHTPVPALGKDKNRTGARRPHAGCTWISDVIVMLK